jgi:uncharacterized protein
MKFLIDIGHPAHIHYFKYFAKLKMAEGDEVLFTCRDKDITISLLEYYNFNYLSFGKPFTKVYGKLFGLFIYTFKIFIISLKFKPDLFLNSSMYSAFVSWLIRKPHISLEDTFNKEQVSLYLPFTSFVLTGDYEHPSLGKKEVIYKSYQELFYLHPTRFNPDHYVRQELGLTDNEKYVIVRFVSWQASHDIGQTGISYENKVRAVHEISKYAKVFISSESPLSDELEALRFPIPPYRMHHAMAFSSLIFGESATMITEGAMLGVPGIYLDKNGRYYTRDLEARYGLVFNFGTSESDQVLSIEKAIELLAQPGIDEVWIKKRDMMLESKIDPTSFLIWFIDNFPGSVKIVKDNPEYQLRFKQA